MSSYFDPCSYPYSSRREIVYGRNGMVCTSQALAAQAGLDMLKKGGNAVDAALATAIALTVLEPTSNGLGSDLFALIWTDGRLYGLNGSGHSPAKMTPHILAEQGYTEMRDAQTQPAGWLKADAKKMTFEVTGLPAREDAEPDIKDQLIVEFYSR